MADIEADAASWDNAIATKAALKSIPSGVMQDEKTGKRFPITEYTEKMISISDNTETDHLLFHVGRERVEAMQAEMGHGEPEVNAPFLSTREMSVMKLSKAPNFAKSFLEADVTARRKLIAGPVAKAKLPKKFDDPNG